tara:strand:- start:288 stop:584 length:297 start_codon:yes stop_codon:yes gene_type:complete
MTKRKKPTMNEMKNVVSNIIVEINNINEYLHKIDTAVFSYIKYKGDDKKFLEWANKQKGESTNDSGATIPKESGANSGTARKTKDGEQNTKGSKQKTK